MFEVLMYLFENYMQINSGVVLTADPNALMVELEQVGFTRGEINLALDWLDGLSLAQEAALTSAPFSPFAIRHYLPEERERLGKEGIGFLLYLEQLSILDPTTREVVLDRIMALDGRDVDMGRIKWVVLIALFNQPDKKSALSVLQDMILSDSYGILH